MPVILTLLVAVQLQAGAALAGDADRVVPERSREVPTTLRAVHLRDLASREEPAAEPPSREKWLDRFGTTKGGFKYQETLLVGDRKRKVKLSVKGPFLRSQQPGLVFEVKF